MPHWLLKSSVHRFISWLPQSHRWNALFQRTFTGSLDMPYRRFEHRVKELGTHRTHLTRYRPQLSDKEFNGLELGTGWYPIAPVPMHLSGANQVWSYDIVPLATPERAFRTLQLFVECHQKGRLRELLPELDEQRIETLASALDRPGAEADPMALYDSMKITLKVGDVCDASLDPGSVDLIWSHVVLPHVPAPVLARMFAAFHRFLSPEGMMSHEIGLKDQYAAFDRSLNPLNFYRFTDGAWRWLNSPIIPQNRLRINDYRSLLQDAGFEPLEEILTKEDPSILNDLPLADKFRGYSEDDLRTIWAVIISCKAPSKTPL